MHFLALVVAFILLTGCSPPESESPQSTARTVPDAAKSAVAFRRFAAITNANFLTEAQRFDTNTNRFLEAPTKENLSILQGSWLSAHKAYSHGQFGLLVDDLTHHAIRFRVDAWPIQPGFIDNLPQYPQSGIVFDNTIDITLANLLAQHGITDDEEVILGFHGLELLLFTRPIEDFAIVNDDVVKRRRVLLKLVSQQLRDDAEQLVALSGQSISGLEDNELMQLVLQDISEKIRVLFRESNLVAAQGSGHGLTQARSLEILEAELIALENYMVKEVPLASSFQQSDPVAYNNFIATLAQANALLSGDRDSLAISELPLVLAALTHQLEAFTKAPAGF